VFTSSRPVKKRSIHVVSSWTRNHDRWTRVDMTSCLTKLTIRCCPASWMARVRIPRAQFFCYTST